MTACPSVLIITTQTWLQVTRLAMRFASYGCRIAVICPHESHLTYAPIVSQRFSFRLTNPVNALRHAILASGADYLVPTDDLSVWLLHDLAAREPSLRDLIDRSLGDSRHHATLRSRFQLLSLAHRLGIAVPRTELIGDEQELDVWCAPEAPPFVLKKDGTWGGNGVQIVHSSGQAHTAFDCMQSPTGFNTRVTQWLRNGDGSAFSRPRCLSRPEITAQSLISGVPANSMYACHEGKVLGEVQARVVAAEGKTGPSLVIELMRDPRITRAGQLLAGELKLSGFFGLDFMLDERTGEPLLIELNPRSTQLGHLAVAGQADLAGLLWAQWTGQPVPASGQASLGSAIYFYPKGKQWTDKTARLRGCRSDVVHGEQEMLDLLANGNPGYKSRLRRRLWGSLAQLKGSLQNDLQPQAFYYQDLSPRREEAKMYAADGVRRKPVVSIAS